MISYTFQGLQKKAGTCFRAVLSTFSNLSVALFLYRSTKRIVFDLRFSDNLSMGYFSKVLTDVIKDYKFENKFSKIYNFWQIVTYPRSENNPSHFSFSDCAMYYLLGYLIFQKFLFKLFFLMINYGEIFQWNWQFSNKYSFLRAMN